MKLRVCHRVWLCAEPRTPCMHALPSTCPSPRGKKKKNTSVSRLRRMRHLLSQNPNMHCFCSKMLAASLAAHFFCRELPQAVMHRLMLLLITCIYYSVKKWHSVVLRGYVSFKLLEYFHKKCLFFFVKGQFNYTVLRNKSIRTRRSKSTLVTLSFCLLNQTQIQVVFNVVFIKLFKQLDSCSEQTQLESLPPMVPRKTQQQQKK